MDSHPYSHETSIFTLGAPHEEVQGRQTKLHPGFTMGLLGIRTLRPFANSAPTNSAPSQYTNSAPLPTRPPVL